VRGETTLGRVGVRAKHTIHRTFESAQWLGRIDTEPQDPRRLARASRRKHAHASQRKLEAWHTNLAQMRPHVSKQALWRVAEETQGDVQLLGPRPARAAYALAQTHDLGPKLRWQVHRDE
jgi:hypothetical protein